MRYRPHLLCKIHVVLTSKLEKLVMVKFCSAMTLTSVKVSKMCVQKRACALRCFKNRLNSSSLGIKLIKVLQSIRLTLLLQEAVLTL